MNDTCRYVRHNTCYSTGYSSLCCYDDNDADDNNDDDDDDDDDDDVFFSLPVLVQ